MSEPVTVYPMRSRWGQSCSKMNQNVLRISYAYVRVCAALDDGKRRRVRWLTTHPVSGEVLGSANI